MHAGIFPRDCGPGLDLGPGNLRIVAAAIATLGDEIVDAAQPFRIAGIPVLHRRIFDLGVIQRDQFDHRGVKLVFIALRRGAAFEVADVGALVGDDQGTLRNLPGVALIDGGNRSTAPSGSARPAKRIDKRAVGKHRRIQRGEEIVRGRNDRPEILAAPVRDARGWLPRSSMKITPACLRLLLEGGRRPRRCRRRRRRRSSARPRASTTGLRAPRLFAQAECRASRRFSGFQGRPRRASCRSSALQLWCAA